MGSEISSEKRESTLVVTTAEQAYKLLLEAEAKDSYRDRIFTNEIESKARKDHNYFPLSNSQYNRKNLQDWCNTFIQETEKNKHFSWIINTLKKISVKVYIINLQFSADGGMPHTRPLNNLNEALICLPGGLRGAEFEKTTLIHELIHVIQRFNPTLWAHFYSKYWSMSPYKGSLPNKYELARRINPDTIPTELYIYRNKWVSFTCFKDVTSPDIRDTVIYYYNTISEAVWTVLPDELENDPIFGDHKVSPPMREHPNELSAFILAEPDRFSECWVKQHFIDFSNYN